MIKVFFDHQTFSLQRFGGISRYFANIIAALKINLETDYKLGVLYTDNYYIKDEHQPLDNSIFRYWFRKIKRRNKWNKSYSKYLIKKNDFDVFHATYFNPYFLKELQKPLVITVHDMTYEALPEFFPTVDPLPWQKRLLVEKADKIIAISETTKKDLINYLNVDAQKIEVIYHGIDFSAPICESINSGLPEKYLLFVGERGGYKNFFMLAEAFKILRQKHPALQLVLAGGGALSFGDREFLIRNNILDQTIQMSVTDGQLNTLYQNAACFIFPSLYEGFGFPILEAFKNDCPILLSDCSCFEEIAGSTGRYFHHKSIESLVNEIEIILTDEEIKAKMIAAGKERLQHFSLEKCLHKTIELYKSLVKN